MTSTSSGSPSRARRAGASAPRRSTCCCAATPAGWSTTAGWPPTTGSTSMISGARRLALLLGLLLVAAAPAAGAWGIEQLMQDLARVKTAKGTFVERKHLAILTAPLESSGTLTYTAPDRLEKHTLVP